MLLFFQVYYVYLLKCGDGSLYTGITLDVARRLSEHREGTASRYTRSRKAVKMLYSEKVKDRSKALKREAAIKKLTRKAKLSLIRGSK
ncbi:GIY-YIG nuclease family protein [Candidatus Parcubacteria bacterium]|nr:GIY-YIG nuclease family protein [Candidatus Parcubacteria bacterium]